MQTSIVNSLDCGISTWENHSHFCWGISFFLSFFLLSVGFHNTYRDLLKHIPWLVHSILPKVFICVVHIFPPLDILLLPCFPPFFLPPSPSPFRSNPLHPFSRGLILPSIHHHHHHHHHHWILFQFVNHSTGHGTPPPRLLGEIKPTQRQNYKITNLSCSCYKDSPVFLSGVLHKTPWLRWRWRLFIQFFPLQILR